MSWLSGLDATPTASRVCAGCHGTVEEPARWALCRRCMSTLANPASQVASRGPGTVPTYAVGAYEGPLREAIVAFKDHGRWSLREPLGRALARAVAAAAQSQGLLDDGHVVVVAAAGSRGSARQRDGDHVREIALVAVRELRRHGIGARHVPALTSRRRRRDQVGLGRAQRWANLHGSMVATSSARALRCESCVVLVDDVVTSGATMAEADRALRALGVRACAAAVIAATAGPGSAIRGARPR
jgi:predicted amidophosphoribosyltransferase